MKLLLVGVVLVAALVVVPAMSEELRDLDEDEDYSSLMTGRRASLSTGSVMNFGTASAFSQGMVIPSFSLNTLGGGPLEQGDEEVQLSEGLGRRRKRQEWKEKTEKERIAREKRNDSVEMQSRTNSILGLGKTILDSMKTSDQIMQGPGHKCIDSIETLLMECHRDIEQPTQLGDTEQSASTSAAATKVKCTQAMYDDMKSRFEGIRAGRCKAAIRSGYAPACCTKDSEGSATNSTLGESSSPSAANNSEIEGLKKQVTQLVSAASTANAALANALKAVGSDAVPGDSPAEPAEELSEEQIEAAIAEQLDAQCDAALCWLNEDQEVAKYQNARFTVPYPKASTEEEEQKYYMVKTDMQATRTKAMFCFKTREVKQPLLCTIQRKTEKFTFSNTKANDLSSVMAGSSSAESGGADSSSAESGGDDGTDERRRRKSADSSSAESGGDDGEDERRRRKKMLGEGRWRRRRKKQVEAATLDMEVTGTPPDTQDWKDTMDNKAVVLLSTMNAWIRL